MTRFPPLLTPRVASYYVVVSYEAKGPGVFVVLLEALYCHGLACPLWIREKSLPIKTILVFRLSTRVSVICVKMIIRLLERPFFHPLTQRALSLSELKVRG